MSQLASFFQISKSDLDEAKQHLWIALDEFQMLPTTHEALIEKLREYFEDQKVEVFSRIVSMVGEADFRDFIAEAVIESGKYHRGEVGQVRPTL